MKTLLFLLSIGVCAATDASFPKESISYSPDFRWQVRCTSSEQGDGVSHKILLGRSSTKGETPIWTCSRHCDILWSNDSARLAITDWTGSNLSEIYIVEMSAPKARKLEIAGFDKLCSREELTGHCYFEALKWETAHRLVIRIFGHTDENPSHDFAYYFSVDTSSGDAKPRNQEGK